VAEQPRAQLDVDLAGRMSEYMCAQTAQQNIEDRNGEQPDRDDIQCGEAVMDQHLVHHHLIEQRRHQGEQLDKERDGENFYQQLAVLHHRRHEPTEIELRELTERRRA
jgi:hypothetical protein